MIKLFRKLFHLITSLWRTRVSTFVKDHVYTKDIDKDGVSEIIVDVNGNKINDTVLEKEEYYDRESN